MKSVLFRNILQFTILGFSLILLYACAEQENQQQQTQIEETIQPAIIEKPSTYAYYEILSEDFYQLTREEGQKWQSNFDLLDYHKVLVLSELNNEEDYEQHNEYLEKYIAASEHYFDFLNNLKSIATEKFMSYNIPEEQVTPVLDHLLSVYEKQKGTLAGLLKSHIEYGKDMKSLLKFLQTNQQAWKLVDGKIDMENKELAAQYNAIIDEIVSVEDQIEQYSRELDFLLR